MAKATPGFKLYLYQLLSRELGFGKQTLLPQLEEVLAADDIIPADLECTTVQELVETCPDFLKLTVFKKGRVYATVLRNEEWDQMLAAPEEKPAAKKGGAAGGPKTWKKKKGGKKALKPVKPGKHRRDREAAGARAAEERAQAEAVERERAKAEAAERKSIEAKAAQQKEPAAQLEEASTLASADESGGTQAQGGSDADSQPEGMTATEGSAELPQADRDQMADNVMEGSESPAADRPVARTIAEILAESRAAEAEAKAAAAKEPVAEPQAPATPESEAQEAPVAAPQQEPAALVETSSPQMQAPEMAPEPEPALGPEAVPQPEPAPTPEPLEAAPQPATEAPPAPVPAPISITITYDPYEDMERELERQRREEPPVEVRERAPRPAPTTAPAKPAIPLTDLPQDFGTEVSCKDALLRTLYQLLPYDVDPMAVLDEDWRMARSTGSLSGSRNRVTFPLRYLHEDGSPITITLRKTTKSSFGKQWSLTLVDGDDGTGGTHLSVGIEGLPSADEGAWSDLGGSPAGDVSASPIRALAQQVVIGTWDAFLGGLAATAAPERWNYPGEGVGRQSRYGILREYIATTYLRASQQERIATSVDGSFAAFHTGLGTSLGDDIYACLTKRSGDIPWQFAGFATAGSGELGARLTGTIAQLPQPASYLSSLSDVMPDCERMVILDTEAILGHQLGRLPRAFLLERLENNVEARDILAHGKALTTDDLSRLSRVIKSDASAYRRLRRALDDAVEQAMRSTRASYRIAVPAFDPADGKTKLLVPLCLVEDGRADCALVLDLQPSGAYRAAAILSLPRAYACARVISREQPRWLSASTVL